MPLPVRDPDQDMRNLRREIRVRVQKQKTLFRAAYRAYGLPAPGSALYFQNRGSVLQVR